MALGGGGAEGLCPWRLALSREQLVRTEWRVVWGHPLWTQELADLRTHSFPGIGALSSCSSVVWEGGLGGAHGWMAHAGVPGAPTPGATQFAQV